MNREQAEHILDAYINMECGGGDNKARQSLREVILDAMTEYKTQTVSTYPRITLPANGTPFGTSCTTGVAKNKTINKIDDSVIDNRFCSLFDRYITDARAWGEGKEK